MKIKNSWPEVAYKTSGQITRAQRLRMIRAERSRKRTRGVCAEIIGEAKREAKREKAEREKASKVRKILTEMPEAKGKVRRTSKGEIFQPTINGKFQKSIQL